MNKFDERHPATAHVLTTSGAAILLGVAVSTVQKWVESGQLASWKTPGGHRRIPMAAIDQLLGGAPFPQVQGSGTAMLAGAASAPAHDAVDDEQARVRAVVATRLLDTPPQPSYDRLVRLASQVIDTPIAV